MNVLAVKQNLFAENEDGSQFEYLGRVWQKSVDHMINVSPLNDDKENSDDDDENEDNRTKTMKRIANEKESNTMHETNRNRTIETKNAAESGKDSSRTVFVVTVEHNGSSRSLNCTYHEDGIRWTEDTLAGAK